MHATVHIADHGVRALPRWRRSGPRVDATPGLCFSLVATPAPLGTGLPRPQFGRLARISFWADRDAAGAALDGTALGDEFDGLRLDLEAVRAVGAWTGLPADLPTAPDEVHRGPAVVITIGRLRLLQARRFFAASAKAEKHILASPGLSWASGMAAVERRTLVTLSWWHDQTAMDATVRGPGGHRNATAQQHEKDFHHESAFIRFRPVAVSGRLSGRNGVSGLSAIVSP